VSVWHIGEREQSRQASLLAAHPHMRINQRVDALALLPHAPHIEAMSTPQPHP